MKISSPQKPLTLQEWSMDDSTTAKSQIPTLDMKNC